MDFYAHHIGDFLAATHHLSHEERSVYLMLMWIYYDTEQPLAGDVTRLAKKVRAQVEVVEEILGEFFQFKGGQFHHARIDGEVAKDQAKLESARNAGKASGRARRRERTANGSRTESNDRCESVEPTNNQEPETNEEHCACFEDFWREWPKKERKAPAKKKWIQKRLDEHATEIVADVIARKLDDERWARGIIMHPATYLNQEAWKDEWQPGDTGFARGI